MKDCVQMLQDIDEFGEGLSVENGKFLDDMLKKVEKGGQIKFSEGQMKYIRSLWYEKVPEEWR